MGAVNVLSQEETSKRFMDYMFHHGDELKDIVEKDLTGDSEGNSYLTKKDVEYLLSNHFLRIEKLLNSYEQPSDYEDFPNRLKTYKEDFYKNLKEYSALTKGKMVDGVSNVRVNISEKVTDVKEYAKTKINGFVSNINEKIKGFTQFIDHRLGNEVEHKEKKAESNKEETSKTEQPIPNKPSVVLGGKSFDFSEIASYMDVDLARRLDTEMVVFNDQLFVDCYVQRAFIEDPEFIKIMESKFGVMVERLDPNEEAMVIQENAGLTSNTVEWDNEKLISYLEENNTHDYQRFINFKKIALSQNEQLQKKKMQKSKSLGDMER